MTAGQRSTVGQRVLVAVLAAELVALVAGFWLQPFGDEVSVVLAAIGLLAAFVLVGAVIYRAISTGTPRASAIRRQVPAESRSSIWRAWRTGAEGVPPSLYELTRTYAAIQVVAYENAALVAATFGLIWTSRGIDSPLDAVLRGVAVCFVVVGLCSVYVARGWRRLRSSISERA